MFYTTCKDCGFSRRWLTEEESKDKELVAASKRKKITAEELAEAALVEDTVIEGQCFECEEKSKAAKEAKKAKKKTKKVKEEAE